MPIFMNYGGIKGEPTGQSHRDELQMPATVLVGEKNIGQVANRLGLSKDDLLRANPQIKDPSNLKVGQEIHLPPHPGPTSEISSTSSPNPTAAKGLPKAPIGASIDSSVVKGKLNALAATQGQTFNASLAAKKAKKKHGGVGPGYGPIPK